MNYLFFILKSALEDFQRNKIRTFLTSLGILIGVLSVVLLVAIGLGLKAYIQQQFNSLGSDLIFIMPGNISGGNLGSSTGIGGINFDERDVTTLKKVKDVSMILPFYVKFVKSEAQGNAQTNEMAASTQDLFTGLNVEIAYGRAFTKADNDKGSKKVVLGSQVAEKLFGSQQNAVGKTVKLDGQAFQVVGVAKSKGGGGIGGASVDSHIFVPIKATYSGFNPDKKYYAIYLKATDTQSLGQVKADARKLLLKRYKPDDFSVSESSEFLSAVNSIFTILNSVLVAIAAISLVVGGIGIMNIMYVSVTERIREIGIRRAIGATRLDILYQFLSEAILLSLLGGILGLLIAFIIVLILRNIFPAYIDLQSVIISLGVSSVIGVIFGVFPAKKASELSPIEAIRYE